MSVPDHRIIDVTLDEHTILWRNADIEQERRIAIYDLLEGNRFAPQRAQPDGYTGPYRVRLRVEDGRLAIDIRRADDSPLETLVLGLAKFRRPIRDYFAICDSYYQALRQATPQQIETIDMARRGIHNQAAELLMDRYCGPGDDLRVDVLLLGVGPDGHVASLFPHHPSFEEGQRAGRSVIAVHDSPKPPPTRLSLTLPVIQAAEQVWCVVSGEDKADAVAEALAGPGDLPASRATGAQRTLWLIDEAAASRR